MSLLEEIITWAQGLKTWQQDALRRIFAQPDLSEDDVDAVLQLVCSGLMKPDTHLGENARQNEVSDDQTTPYLFP